jgi:hypothetical protein
MKKRLITALAVAALGAAVGVGIAIYAKQQHNMLGICLTTAGVGFLFGLLFKIRIE